MNKPTTKFSPAERRNWGYWDGVADAERGRWPKWNKMVIYRQKHPFDKPYGEGYWAGRYNEPHQNEAAA